MIKVNRVQKHLEALDSGDDDAKKEALGQLRTLEQSDWDEAPPTLVHAVLETFQRHLLQENKVFVRHKDIALILASMRTLSKTSVPQLCDLLQDGIPDCVREA